jgi:hypothetical protein
LGKIEKPWFLGLRMLLTTYLVVVGLVIFRAPDLTQAWEMLLRMHLPLAEASPLTGPVFAWVGIVFAVFSVVATGLHTETGGLRSQRYPWALCAALTVFSLVFHSVFSGGRGDNQPFIYFFF